MESERQSDSGLDQLRQRWLRRLDDALAQGAFSSSELSDLARRYRTLAGATDSHGQQQGALIAAERFEKAAQEQVAINS